MTQHTNAFPELECDLRFIPLEVNEPRELTPTQIRRYNEAGHLFPIDIFLPTEIAEIRAYIDDLLLGRWRRGGTTTRWSTGTSIAGASGTS